MNRGFVKLWRKSLDAGWLKNHKLWAFWSWCILKASYQEHKQIIGCQEITLQPGQFSFGRKKAAKELRVSEQETRTLLVFLKNAGNLTIKSTNKFSIITVVNWPIYQGSIEDDQPSDQPTTNHQLTTNKNIKKEKNKYMSESDFNLFYQSYPKREGRTPALKAWRKITSENGLLNTILAAIEKQKAHKEHLKKTNQFCPEWPLPATWLNGRRWEDEVPEVKASRWM